jgi:hypothetical protein
MLCSAFAHRNAAVGRHGRAPRRCHRPSGRLRARHIRHPRPAVSTEGGAAAGRSSAADGRDPRPQVPEEEQGRREGGVQQGPGPLRSSVCFRRWFVLLPAGAQPAGRMRARCNIEALADVSAAEARSALSSILLRLNAAFLSIIERFTKGGSTRADYRKSPQGIPGTDLRYQPVMRLFRKASKGHAMCYQY